MVKRVWTALVCLALISSVMLLAGGASGSEPSPEFEDGVVLVGFAAGTTWDEKVQIGYRLGAVARVNYESVGATLFDVPPGSVLEKTRAFANEPAVVFAEPNHIVRALITPNDTSWINQWGPQKIQAPEGWDLYPGNFGGQGGSGTGVKTAVVDTGILASHADLNDGRVLTSLGANCVSGSCSASPATDDHGHGTHVAGTIAAETNNLAGIAGVAFNSTMIPVKVLNSSGSGTDVGVANGIIWAAQKGAKVINLSLGGGFSTTMCNAVSTAINTYGSAVVAASGNSGVEGVSYPAACPGAVAVGATSSADSRASFSTFGSQLWNTAPGVDILSTYQSSYAYLSGTSMASPHAASVAAMISSQTGGSISVSDIKKRLASTTDKVGTVAYGPDPNGLGCSPACTWNKYYGYGRVNLNKAMQAGGPGFTLGASPSSRSVNQGAGTNYAISVTRTGGFTSDVTLSVSGLPAGASGSFSPNPVLSSQSSSTMTVTTASTTPGGTYTLTITGVGDTLTRTTTVALTVVPPDFSLSASPSSVTITPGASASYTVGINRVGGFSDAITLSVSGLPTGTASTFNPNPASGNSSTLSITSASSTPPGSYALTITGTSGVLIRTASATLVVRAPRTLRNPYVGVTGDLLNTSCLGLNVGGSCMPVFAGETSVTFTIDDDMGWRVGGYWRFLSSTSVTLASGYFCDSSSQPVPSGAVRFQVFVEEAFSTIDCDGWVGAGTTGWVEASFL